MKDKLKKIIIEFITNPIILIAYWLFCYELSTLCMYGRYKNNIYFLIGCIILFLGVKVFYILKIRKINKNGLKSTKSKNRICISIIIISMITVFYGVKIYKSAVNYGGKLSWVIQSVKNERKVKFDKDNIYQYGLDGIFEDINKKVKLPKKLYLSGELSVKFEKNGIINYFEGLVYGKNENGKDSSYLIYYNKAKSNKIKVILNGYANPDYKNANLMDPLFETVNCISIKNTVSKWKENEFGLLYKGKRDWGGNREGIVLVNKNGNKLPTDLSGDNLVGYTVSIYVPGKEEQITPVRYNLLTDSYWFKFLNTDEEDKFEESKKELGFVTGESKSNDEFYLKDGVRYKLNVEDKATCSFFYSLQQTTDGGNKWVVINEDPFNGAVGEAFGMFFIDENVGFIGATRNGGSEGELYRTENGGKSFERLTFENKSVTLENGVVISPFDFPNVPYEKDGKLYLKVGQGADGDYNGNSSLLYVSRDKGKTWDYVKEVKDDN
ncbi:BNR repeat-containing glycosyl hydrolase [[Clostridium] sordellii]|uniref:WD40/YVTN/BNR-like repeat-containing protein n=2 Tax=Paraclostridium sordellii TaxID=1505 RepID=UPI0005E82B29|nr:hypothetical protein [Paeniclostridium sordellii]MCQ4696656.1 hypothetical protein [Paeniclostridium sordellii]MDU2148361.1 hypothetical protein [Paeniclostridium sordellii]MDU4414414.1 hypothetical protein [Paeniclostridium sordellii]CEN83941.1 BNR repeat-containing glycosyl hydrolase [[Clostridium] sordellii] [Paeniclostridium sordellii]CEO10086.1 BNR repeat-containing glycosyl hydrolase [[Clostridium] sordellii] [Paeniclostridium sordellii]